MVRIRYTKHETRFEMRGVLRKNAAAAVADHCRLFGPELWAETVAEWVENEGTPAETAEPLPVPPPPQ